MFIILSCNPFNIYRICSDAAFLTHDIVICIISLLFLISLARGLLLLLFFLQGSQGVFFFFELLNFIYFFLQQVLIVIHFIHISVYVSIPISQFNTPPPPCNFSPLVSIRLFSTSVSQFLPCKPVHLYHFSRFYIYALIYDICFSLLQKQNVKRKFGESMI